MPGSEPAETQLKANDHHVRERIDGVHRAGPGRLGRPRHRRAGCAVDRPARSRGLRVARAPDRTRPDHASALARGDGQPVYANCCEYAEYLGDDAYDWVRCQTGPETIRIGWLGGKLISLIERDLQARPPH